MARWQATVATHLPLGNPAIMLSGRIDPRERVKESVLKKERDKDGGGQRYMDESKEGKNVRFQKWPVRFYHAQWKGDISVMLYSSRWHFKLIKASNNYADWKDGGWVDTQWANTLNNAAISHSLSLILFLRSLNFIPVSINFSAMTPASHWKRRRTESLSSNFLLLDEETLRIPLWQVFTCFKASYMKPVWVQINNVMILG